MTDKRRVENIVDMTDTLWQLNRSSVIAQIEKLSGAPVPKDCIGLIECSFRFGAIYMEKAIGRK